jgi:hypothetical protein
MRSWRGHGPAVEGGQGETSRHRRLDWRHGELNKYKDRNLQSRWPESRGGGKRGLERVYVRRQETVSRGNKDKAGDKN